MRKFTFLILTTLLVSGESEADEYENNPPKLIQIYSTKGIITKKKIEITKDVEEIYIMASEILGIEPDAFCAQPILKTMTINANSKFPPIARGCFKCLQNLESFIAYNNHDLEVDFEAFSELKHLKTLTVNNVKIGRVTKNMFKNLDLIMLTLQSDDIREIDVDAFSTLPNLEHLYLNHNNLTTIKPNTFKNLNKLKVLWIFKNKISDLKLEYFNPLPSLTFLDVVDNNIKHFDVSKLKEYFPKIKILNLGGSIVKKEEEEIKIKAKSLNVDIGFHDYYG